MQPLSRVYVAQAHDGPAFDGRSLRAVCAEGSVNDPVVVAVVAVLVSRDRLLSRSASVLHFVRVQAVLGAVVLQLDRRSARDDDFGCFCSHEEES